MQKNKILAIVLLILVLLAAGLVLKNKERNGISNGITMPDREIAYENFDEVTRVVLNRKNYPVQVFTREANKWILNKNSEVDISVFNNLKSVLQKVSILYIPTKAAIENIYKDLEKNGIQVQLFDAKDNLLRSYTVGTETADGKGTPFMVDGAKQPYIMHLPGLEGSVRNRMTYQVNEWKSKDVFHLDPSTIKRFSIRYPRDKASSFLIVKDGNGYKVTNPDQSNDDTKTTNQKTVESYLLQLQLLEGEYNDENNPERANISSKQPFCFIDIDYDDGKNEKMTFFSYIDISRGIETTSPNNIHVDNKFFVQKSNGQFILIQYRVLKNILKPNLYFY